MSTPTGRAPEAWARLCITAPERRRLLRVLYAVADAMDEPKMRCAVEALERDLGTLLTLGCPTPKGWEPMAVPGEILGRGFSGGSRE